MRAILAPIDGSPSSNSALSVSTSIAALSHAKLHGLFVEDERRYYKFEFTNALLAELGIQPYYDSPRPAGEILEEVDKIQSEANNLTEDFQTACQKANIQGEFVSEYGAPADAIEAAAKRVDLVCLGNSGGHSGILGAHAGDTVTALLHRVSVPILVVPDNPVGEARIVLAYDDSQASQRTLRFIASFAELTTMDIDVLTVGDDSSAVETMQKPALDYLSNYEVDVRPVRKSGKVIDEILNYSVERDASIIAIGGPGSHPVREKIFGSITEGVINDSQAATLLVS